MVFVSVAFDYSPGFNSPESWIKSTRIYNGILEHLGKSHTVISVKQIDYIGDYSHNGIQHKFVCFSKKRNYFPFKLNYFIKRLNPDVIILQGLHRPLQFLQLRLLLTGNTKIIAHHHAEKPLNGPKKYLQRLADRYIDAYLFASRDIGLEWIKEGNLRSPSKIHEVMEVSSVFYTIDKEIAQAKTKVTGSTIFLWVGRLNANKDPLNVVNALLKFAAISPFAKLYMIYQTDELLEDILDLLKDHPYKDAVMLIGKVPNDDLLYWYNSADFIISGSFYEGSGTAICEAMSCGCIPVVTEILSFRMITDNGKCGILYEAGNEAALLGALKQTREINITEKRDNCLSYFKSTLSFEAISVKIQEIAATL